ncbi:MAG: ABC transporter ATP-binding protein [Pseudomonadales bacterium]|jgi:ABC-2 type transport system ATP-binding protein|nr:ABC transporter ATP-binding protein [Pseudomonadales bacterium]MBL6817427.1 ABC transporter ATP-binding protein [Pseudomonadales bacterium]
MSSEPPALSVTGLYKKYGQFEVLKGLDLVLYPGAIHGLVGLNGSGKTTTLECILGLQDFDRGEIRVLGHGPRKLHAAQGRIVAIFDTPSLNPNLTVRQSLRQALLLCDGAARKPAEVEAQLGITKFSDFKIKNLSLGNKRRASIAHALLANPEIILLDEPFNGLDAGGVDEVLALIKDLNQQQGTSFLLSSHQLPYLEEICSHIAILHDGQIAASDEKSRLLGSVLSTIRIQTNDNHRAAKIIGQQAGLSLQTNTSTDILLVNSEKIGPADINRQLVEQGLAVSEIVAERASLDSLFRRITQEPNP